jgi:lipopolysaccharide/colanic/teichoic acid biosynthesis glycosyltransferase
MSLVGPRPLLERELDRYGENICLCHLVHPGITGLWQVSGRSETTFDERAQLDAWYVKNWTLWYDIVILLRTVKVVSRREGAY